MSDVRIMINPGHDSSIGSNGLPVDSGAVYDDVYECDIVMDVGMMVADYLQAAGISNVTVLQQDNLAGEYPYSYRYSIVGQANMNKVDYVISIHANAAANESANGCEVLVYDYNSPANELAQCIHDQICEALDLEPRGIKERNDLAILKATRMPAVLVELAFLSNDKDREKLCNNKDDFAAAIARGVTDFLLNKE